MNETNSKKWPWIVGIIVVVIVIILLSGSKPSESGPIKIGFIGALTGDASGLGTASQSAVKIAVEGINNSGGIGGRPLQVVYEDGQCSPTPANSAAQKLMTVDGVKAIIGGLCSGETSAFAPLAMKNKVITISYCSSAPALSSTGKYFFRTYPSDSYQGKFAADYAYNTLGARKAAVIYHVSDWGSGIEAVFVQEFKNLGGVIVAEEGTPQTTTDYRTIIAKVKATGFDYIFMPVYTVGGAPLIKQLVAAGVKPDKLIAPEDLSDPKFLSDTKGIADGLIITASSVSLSDGFKQKMLAEVKGNEVPSCAPEAYDAVTALAEGIKKVGVNDPDALADAIRASNFKGESGEISFDQNGDLQKASYIVEKIQNGALVPVK